jgi:hypothetical protein
MFFLVFFGAFPQKEGLRTLGYKSRFEAVFATVNFTARAR